MTQAIPPRHPRDLPRLTTLPFPLARPPLVLLVDANLVLRDAQALARGRNARELALTELLHARQVRVVMSASDVRLNGDGVPRVEATIRSKKYRKDAPGMLQAWREIIRPRLLILDPAGLPDTMHSAQVRLPERDADDADLALLGHALNADGIFSYDHEAFADLLPTLQKKGEHGQILCAFRDDLRVSETIALLVGSPMYAAWAAVEAGKSLARALKVNPLWMAAGAAVGAAALLVHPTSRGRVGSAALTYWNYCQSVQPTPEVQAEIETARQRVFVSWGDSEDPRIRIARHLIRQPVSMTTTALCQATGITQPVSQVAELLRRCPGLFTEVTRGRWEMTRDASSSDELARAEHGHAPLIH